MAVPFTKKVHGCFTSLDRGDDPQFSIRQAAMLAGQGGVNLACYSFLKPSVTRNELLLQDVVD